MQWFTWVHDHSHGIDVGVFRSKKDIINMDLKEIAHLLKIEIMDDEHFDVDVIDINGVVEI